MNMNKSFSRCVSWRSAFNTNLSKTIETPQLVIKQFGAFLSTDAVMDQN